MARSSSTRPTSPRSASKPAPRKPAARTAAPVRAKPAAKPAPKRAAKPARRSPAEEAARVARLLAALDALYPDAHCELDFRSPFQLLVATVLSAQCTDKRVNMVTPGLFARYPDPATLAEADRVELEKMIQSTGFFRNKAKSLLGAGRVLAEDFGGEVPRTMDELLTVPGVARKTANVVLGSAYGINVGFVVDTHIGRLARRLALSREEDPVKVERDLMARVPQDKWTQVGHQLIWHGRRICQARKPACDKCPLAPDCPSAGIA